MPPCSLGLLCKAGATGTRILMSHISPGKPQIPGMYSGSEAFLVNASVVSRASHYRVFVGEFFWGGRCRVGTVCDCDNAIFNDLEHHRKRGERNIKATRALHTSEHFGFHQDVWVPRIPFLLQISREDKFSFPSLSRCVPNNIICMFCCEDILMPEAENLNDTPFSPGSNCNKLNDNLVPCHVTPKSAT